TFFVTPPSVGPLAGRARRLSNSRPTGNWPLRADSSPPLGNLTTLRPAIPAPRESDRPTPLAFPPHGNLAETVARESPANVQTCTHWRARDAQTRETGHS